MLTQRERELTPLITRVDFPLKDKPIYENFNHYQRLVNLLGGEESASAFIRAIEGRFTVDLLCDMLLAGMTIDEILEYR